MSRQQIEFLVKLRDGAQQIADAANEYLETFAPKDSKKEGKVVLEETFSTLKYECCKGSQLGDYEVAYKTVNLPDKWQSAYNILKADNATIQKRYHGGSYVFSYWLYDTDKIYRQMLKSQGKQKP